MAAVNKKGMFNTPRHLHFARLADLLENQLPPERETATRQHLQGCPECASSWLQLNQMVELMRADQTTDAPRDVVAFAIGLFRQRPMPTSRLQRLRATLTEAEHYQSLARERFLALNHSVQIAKACNSLANSLAWQHRFRSAETLYEEA